jgi:hypothetical protein
LGVKILKFFDEDLGSGMETVRIRDPGWKKVGFGINIPDPQHCFPLMLSKCGRLSPYADSTQIDFPLILRLCTDE